MFQRLNWFNFFRLLDILVKYKNSSILFICELDDVFCANKQFWVVTHKQQFNYVELMIRDAESGQLYSLESPFYTGASQSFVLRSLMRVPSLVVFILNTQYNQFLSVMRFFNKIGIPLVLVATKNFDFKYFIPRLPFYIFLQSKLSLLEIRDFIFHLIKFIKFKHFCLDDWNVNKFNSTFSSQASFFILLNKWSSVIRGMQFTRKDKKNLFISKNKYNLRLLRKA